ncbi:MAG: serine/threonine-protein kinase [Leptolyngbyaceae cyanobacterium MO_188.B28]|nr:serine/threonine-protein kinase [Leptolyngbyaceae cyanobacterium MO_188.B28]
MNIVNRNVRDRLHSTVGQNFPDFAQYGYQVERSLGYNRQGGRVTYLATQTENRLPVVIKQFQFAQIGSSWSDYQAHEREIALLQHLKSPNIPRYLDSFETANGFCLVQEYKNAPSLAQYQLLTPQDVWRIAAAVLDILVCLQEQAPPVIHRDIKPENLLIERRELFPLVLGQPYKRRRKSLLKIYLVDFGLAHIDSGDVAASSVVKGTLGFMPPEQLLNRKLTPASDLYSLGITLICLLTQTKSTDIGNLIDENFRIHFKPRLPHLHPSFLSWLEKMTAPSLKNRYPNAAAALKALRSVKAVEKTIRRPAIPAMMLTLGLVGGFIASTYHSRYTTTVQPIHGMTTFQSMEARTLASLNEPTFVAPVKEDIRKLRETRQCFGCNLRTADLRNLDLQNSFLRNADLRDSDLRSSSLRNADLLGADLRDADLRGVDLRYANLLTAKLDGAILKSADLRGAILPKGFLTSQDFTSQDFLPQDFLPQDFLSQDRSLTLTKP